MRKSLAFSIPSDITMITPACVRLCDFAARNAMHPRECHRFNVAIDEILSNIILYGFPDKELHHIAIRLDLYTDRIELIIRDDGIPFNPLTYPEPDTTSPLEERVSGGLGIHLVRKLMSKVSYERKNGQNVLRLALYRETAYSGEFT